MSRKTTSRLPQEGRRTLLQRLDLQRFGRRAVLARLALAVVLAVSLAAMMVDWTPHAATRGLAVGHIAKTDLRAETEIDVVDLARTEESRALARESVRPMFVRDVLLGRAVQRRIEQSFGEIRSFLEAQAAGSRPGGVPAGDGSGDGSGAPDEPTGDKSAAGDTDAAGGDGDSASPGGDGNGDVEVGKAVALVESATPAVDPGDLVEQIARFQRTLGVQLSDTDLATLQLAGFSAQIQRDVAELVRASMDGLLVLSRDALPAEGSIVVVTVEGARRDRDEISNFENIRTLNEARRLIAEAANSDFSDRPAHVRQTVVELASQLSVPNLHFDASATEVERELAAGRVVPITSGFQRGEIIVRSGDRIDADALRVLEQIEEEASSFVPWLHHLALSLLLFLFLVLIERFAAHFISKFQRRLNDLIAMGGLLLFVAGICSIVHGIAIGLTEAAPSIPPSAYAYFVPVALGGITVRTLMNSETAMLWGIVASLVCAAIMGGDPFLAIYYLGSVLAASGGLGTITERNRLLRAGFVAALANVALVVALDLVVQTAIQGDAWTSPAGLTGVLYHVVFALAGGLLAGILAVGLVPLCEVLGFLTDSKLLELSNLNHPLMREMIVKAPGTYHHSMVVGSLAEAAAEAIHANSLLARVGAYFHDIGKMLKPGYFIENQREGENPHDRLSASMSALVILNHVKEGIELGRRHGLPEPIIDMIPQHHGTSRVSFFYNKAVQQTDPDKGEVDENDYRYPGPKAQTKEAALMMLADGVEAATRSLKNHTQGAIKARVEKIVNSVIGDGQLDECPLTLRDLHTVSETFVQVLMGIHHHRIEYPAPPTKGGDGRARGLPGSSITLEIPSMTPNPDGVHPLDRAAAERARAQIGPSQDAKPATEARQTSSSPSPTVEVKPEGTDG